MKKEIENLLDVEEQGKLQINNFATLRRWKINALGESCDKLEIHFNFNGVYDYSKEIFARDFKGIVEECQIITKEYFNMLSEKTCNNIKNGYIR